MKVEGDVGTIGITDHAQVRSRSQRLRRDDNTIYSATRRCARHVRWARTRRHTAECCKAPLPQVCLAVLLTRARLPVPQSELGDVVYVELPAVGATLTAGKTFGVVESVKVSPSPVAPPP